MHPPQNVWTASTSENQSQIQSIANGISSEPMSATDGGEMRRDPSVRNSKIEA